MSPRRFTFVSAAHLFLIRDGQILLLRRFNTGYEDGNYSVPAGHLNGGEQVKAAMIREAQEEIGVTLDPQTLEIVGVMHRLVENKRERIDFFLAASIWSGHIANCEPDRCDDLRWFDLDALPENTIPYVRRALENYRQGRWFDGFGWERP